MRRQLGKPFRDANKDDIRNVLKWMEHKSYKASTNEFRQVLKLFYKIVYGNNEAEKFSKLLINHMYQARLCLEE